MESASSLPRLPSLPEPLTDMLDELVFGRTASFSSLGQLPPEVHPLQDLGQVPGGAFLSADGPSAAGPHEARTESSWVPHAMAQTFAAPKAEQGAAASTECKFRNLSQESADLEKNSAASDQDVEALGASSTQIRRSRRQRKLLSYSPSESDDEWAPRKEKRKVGRPVAYSGDPDAAHLTDAEKRQIKRRIANRESARRVRLKKQESSAEMQTQLEHMQRREEAMRQHVITSDHKSMLVFQEMQDMHRRMQAALAAQQQLQQEVLRLQQAQGMQQAGQSSVNMCGPLGAANQSLSSNESSAVQAYRIQP